MANKEKEIIKKLLKIAENQQKIIKKLAQGHPEAEYLSGKDEKMKEKSSNPDPFYSSLDENDPNSSVYKQYDPFYFETPKYQQTNTQPSKKVNITPDTKSRYSPSAPQIPAEVKQMLDAGAPSLKNNLVLTFDGQNNKNVNVRYNKDFVKMSASQLKALLQSVLKGYVVMDPIGYGNSEKDTWHPNY
jgi:hypothetical protein